MRIREMMSNIISSLCQTVNRPNEQSAIVSNVNFPKPTSDPSSSLASLRRKVVVNIPIRISRKELSKVQWKKVYATALITLLGTSVPNAICIGSFLALIENAHAQPFCPSLACSYFRGTYGSLGYFDVDVAGDYAYVAAGGLHIINITNPTNASLVGFYALGTIDAWGVALSGNYAYVASGPVGLQVIDITNLSNPVGVGSYSTPGFAQDVAVLGNVAYMADGSSGLQIIDISTPSNPVFVGGYDTTGDSIGIAVLGNFAYMADGSSGLQIIDISIPSNPSYVGGYDTPGQSWSVKISGNYAYVADSNGGLQIINVTNSSNPTFLASYNTPGNAWDVVVVGDYAYVVDESFGLLIVNITNSSNPIFESFYDTSGFSTGLTVSGNYAYIADEMSLEILKLDCLLSSASTDSSNTGILNISSMSRTSPTTYLSITHSASGVPLGSSSKGKSKVALGVLVSLGSLVLIGSPLAYFYYIRSKKRKTIGQTDESFQFGNELLALESTHKKIGKSYYQLSKIDRDEARGVYKQTGYFIPFPEDKKRIKYVIGKGQFGAIKVAQRIEDGSYVASKKVKGEENMRASEEEANMQRDAAGDNILPIYNTIKLERALYHFMPLAGYGDASDIQDLLTSLEHPKLVLEVIKFVAKDILTGLKTIHEKGIYHLDIKPENMVFTNDGVGYITDFGCAKKATGSQILWNAIGDCRYFSPERLQAIREDRTFDGEKADIWAAGMMLLQLIKNMSPFQLFEMPGHFPVRVQKCDQDYFHEKLNRFKELQYPEGGDIWWVIKGLLDPNLATRFTSREALEASCFKWLNKTLQEKVFEDLKREKLAQNIGMKKEELDIGDYVGVAQAAILERGQKIYDSENYQQFYGVTRNDREQVSPEDVRLGKTQDYEFSPEGQGVEYLFTPDDKKQELV
ncbi:MAG: Serine/threonine-protein kinase PknH [Chlamydiae bacterium]|nr:Serine/threonine-protein kinase PknH [Chlamydiota bacterium]